MVDSWDVEKEEIINKIIADGNMQLEWNIIKYTGWYGNYNDQNKKIWYNTYNKNDMKERAKKIMAGGEKVMKKKLLVALGIGIVVIAGDRKSVV